MECKISRRSFPKSALSLFLKLYCRRRDKTKNKMIEGIQQWLTLTEAEKKQFIKKYKVCQMNYKNKLADYLKKTQPFLKKKKNVKRSLEDFKAKYNIITEPKEDEINAEKVLAAESYNATTETEDHFHTDNETNIGHTMCNTEISSSNEQTETEPSHKNLDHVGPVLAEPATPCIRTARELFEMIQKENGQTQTWALLSSTQKIRYRRAVLLLKNDYITKFKAFLESLPSKELFDYYNNL